MSSINLSSPFVINSLVDGNRLNNQEEATYGDDTDDTQTMTSTEDHHGAPSMVNHNSFNGADEREDYAYADTNTDTENQQSCLPRGGSN